MKRLFMWNTNSDNKILVCHIYNEESAIHATAPIDIDCKYLFIPEIVFVIEKYFISVFHEVYSFTIDSKDGYFF